MPKDNSSNTEGLDQHVGKPGSDSKLMTMAEVANLLRRTDDAVRRLLRTDPSFPLPIRVGAGGTARKRVLFSQSEIAGWIEAQFHARSGVTTQ